MGDSVAVFADVHGQADFLERLILEIHKEAGSDGELYSLGDLIDRGPDSKGVVDLCIKFGVKPVLGNHELWMKMLVEQRVFDSMALSGIMGGKATIRSYVGKNTGSDSALALELIQTISEEHKAFFSSIPYYRKIEVDGRVYWLIHAGLTKNNALPFRPFDLSNTSDDEMMEEIVARGNPDAYILWPSPQLPSKAYPKHNLFTFKDATQVLGHKVVHHPIVTKNFIALDTGCGLAGRKLSAILLPSKKIIQIEDGGWV